MKILFGLLVCLGLLACGVKGDPIPPEEPAYIGRGRPSFRKAVERFDIRTESTADEEEASELDDSEEDE